MTKKVVYCVTTKTAHTKQKMSNENRAVKTEVSKVDIVLNKSDIEVSTHETAQATSRYFCKSDDERSDISYNSLSQVLKFFETDLSDVTAHLYKTNDNKKMNIREFKNSLVSLFKKINLKSD